MIIFAFILVIIIVREESFEKTLIILDALGNLPLNFIEIAEAALFNRRGLCGLVIFCCHG